MLNTIAAIGLLAGGAVAETVHGVVVFTRHGDRTTKHYGAQALTALGASQNYEVGSEYRARYLDPESDHQILGISADEYKSSQIYATAPNQGILSNTATAFLQGLYPPLSEIDPQLATATLNNGTKSTAPLNGYQYVLLQGMDADSPDTIWIKGDDGCPAYNDATEAFKVSDEYKHRLESTREFYSRFYKDVDEVYNLKPENMTYDNAYTIFDLINVARIHNESADALKVSDEDMFQLRTLADSYEFGSNFNASQPGRSIHAKTLSGGILAQLNKTVSTQGKLKFSLLSGSYDTFLAFFGIMDLAGISDDFEGLPDYASTMAFELFSDDTDKFPAVDDLRVRWMFKNGTDGELKTFPLFGQKDEALSWTDFSGKMNRRSINDVATWCDVCASQEDFCAASYRAAEGPHEEQQVSPAVAGAIGAVVTLFVVALIGGTIFVILRKKKQTAVVPVVSTTKDAEKRSVEASSVGSNV